MAPLRRRWEAVQQQAAELIARRDAATGQARTNRERDLSRLLTDFAGEIAAVRVLDPACGSGNFLYVAMKRLLDLEKEVATFAVASRLTMPILQVGPEQLYGIEINPYAHELAQVVVWIGYIQWLQDNGFGIPSSPILKPLHTIERMDAILAQDLSEEPVDPDWPQADFIIGNPPSLGNRKIRAELGDHYVEALRRPYTNRVSNRSDLVCYWFEKARAELVAGRAKRWGLLATQGIRVGRIVRCSIVSRRRATSSGRSRIVTGSLTAPAYTSRWSGLTTA